MRHESERATFLFVFSFPRITPAVVAYVRDMRLGKRLVFFTNMYPYVCGSTACDVQNLVTFCFVFVLHAVLACDMKSNPTTLSFCSLLVTDVRDVLDSLLDLIFFFISFQFLFFLSCDFRSGKSSII